MADRLSPRTLRRYTDLPGLLYMLGGKKLTLLDPRTWDDTNDSYYLLKYKEKRQLKTVLALCMTEAEETYHHWRVFSHGSSGVCIHFDRSRLLQSFSKKRGFAVKSVEYRRVRDVRRSNVIPSVTELPFLKRAGFSDEAEVRIIYESESKEVAFLDVPIDLNSIQKITLSPWLNQRLSNTVKDIVASVEGCGSLNVRRSTLVGNSIWKRLAESAT